MRFKNVKPLGAVTWNLLVVEKLTFSFLRMFPKFKVLSISSPLEKRLNMFATSAQNPEFLSYKDERRFRKLQTSTFRINLSKRKFASNFGYCRHESWKYFAKNFFLHNSSKLFLFRNIWRGGSTWLELGGVDWMIMEEPEFQEETSNRFPTQVRLISTRLR